MEQKSLNEILLAISEYHSGAQKEAEEAIAAIYDAGMMVVDQQPMDARVSWAIKILLAHNQWRRGSDTVEMANPVDIGNAIEIAIGVMDRANRGGINLEPVMQISGLDDAIKNMYESFDWIGETKDRAIVLEAASRYAKMQGDK